MPSAPAAPTTDPRDAAQRWLGWLAVACVVTALVPITFGALTTTEQAGMAVPDYPTTFGQNMVAYDMTAEPPEGAPQSRWHVFLEHTHRLGGMLIGPYLARVTGLPDLLSVDVGGQSFPIVWSVIGAALFTAVLALISRRRR